MEHRHVLRHGPAQGTIGDGRALGIHPFGIVEAHSCPVGKLLAGIVRLTVVFVVAADGTVETDLPFLVGADGLTTAVGKLHNQIETECGVTEVIDLIGLLVLLHRVVTAVADNHSDGILLCQHICDVEGIIEHRSAIVRRCGREYLLSYPLAVDECLVHAQSADIKRGLSHGLVEVELFAQITG